MRIFLLSYFKSFYKEAWSFKLFLQMLFLAIFFFALNQAFSIKKEYVSYIEMGGLKYLKVWLFFFIPMFFTLLLLHKHQTIPQFKKVLQQVLIVSLCYTLAVSYRGFYEFIPENLTRGRAYTAEMFLSSVTRSLLLIGPTLLILKWKIPKSSWGLKFSKKGWSIYLSLGLLVIAMAWLASQNAAFTNFYPMYKARLSGDWLGLGMESRIYIWEGIYAFNFYAVEFFFRGFMVFFFAQYLGARGIWIMAMMYFTIHFSKPEAEAISSYFGGLFLGILSFYSKSIYGGVFLHIALALSVDFFCLMLRV